MNRSSTERCTRIRDRAQQSWPALSKTAYGAVAAAFSRSASANTMLALLPPSSSVSRLICLAQPVMICWPTSVEPVNTILRTAGWSTSRWPTTEPLPGSTWNTPSGSPASSASSPIAHRGQRASSRRAWRPRRCRRPARVPCPRTGSASGSSTARSGRRRRAARRTSRSARRPPGSACRSAVPALPRSTAARRGADQPPSARRRRDGRSSRPRAGRVPRRARRPLPRTPAAGAPGHQERPPARLASARLRPGDRRVGLLG